MDTSSTLNPLKDAFDKPDAAGILKTAVVKLLREDLNRRRSKDEP